jgi:hypothetical protein
MQITHAHDRLVFGDRLRIGFHRTLRVPDDGTTFPLPPGLGLLPIVRALDHRDRLPPEWHGEHVYLIPMYQREALWIGLENDWPPVAIRIATGGISVVSGRPIEKTLAATPQDYVVTPDQLWLDGINTSAAIVRQFVAMPLGQGYTVEGAVTGAEREGGIQITAWPARPGVALRRPTPPEPPRPMPARAPGRMGLGAGGKITQKIYPDPHGVESWDDARSATVLIHLVNSEQYRAIVGLEPPATPVDTATYTAHGLPWFSLYEEHQADVAAADPLARAKTIRERDRELQVPEQDEGIEVSERQIKKLRARPDHD